MFDVSWRDGQLTEAVVRASHDGTYRIALPSGERTVELAAGQRLDLVRCT